MWRVRLLAGGADAGAAARVAGLVCASADLSGLPYALAPAGGAARGLREAWTTRTRRGRPAGGDARPGHPFYASSELVAALTRPPEREMPGSGWRCGPTSTWPRSRGRPRGDRRRRDPGPEPQAAGPLALRSTR